MSDNEIENKFFKVIATSDVFQGGKTLIPKKVRVILGIKDDEDTVIWMQYGDKIIVDTSKRDAFFEPVWRVYEEKLKKK